MGPKAVILAGGLSRRMGGGNKCLTALGGKPMLGHIIERLAPQTADIALNANDDPSLFLDYDLNLLPDVVPDYVGPLAGVLTALEWLKRNWPDDEWVLTAPGDMPFLPYAFATELMTAADQLTDVDLVAPEVDGRPHPLCGLWHIRQADRLRDELTGDGVRAVKEWIGRIEVETVSVKMAEGVSFAGVNSTAELDAAERFLAEGQ